MKFLSLVPMLATHDMNGTIAWYESLLGFECTGTSGDEWCRLERGAVTISFMRNEHLGPPHATATQYIEVDDVMHLFASIEGRCPIEWGPETMPYGMLEFAVKDPNGYLLSFGQKIA